MWSNKPKWTICAAREDDDAAPRTPSAGNFIFAKPSSTVSNGLEAGTAYEYGVRRASDTSGGGMQPIVTLNSRILMQEEIRTQAARSMAESAKRKSEALEERNAMAVFSRPEALSIPETDQFFAAIRKTYLSQALKNSRVAQEKASSGETESARQNAPTKTTESGHQNASKPFDVQRIASETGEAASESVGAAEGAPAELKRDPSENVPAVLLHPLPPAGIFVVLPSLLSNTLSHILDGS